MKGKTTNSKLSILAALAVGAIFTAACSDPLRKPDPAKVAAAAPDSFDVVFETSKGNFTIRAHRKCSPLGVDRFHYLASNGFYNENRFFRVLPGFVAQWGMNGDPEVTAAWDSMKLKDEPVEVGNARTHVTFAKCGMPDCRGTQLFINYADNINLDPMGFGAIGRVIEGMEVVDQLTGMYGENADQARIATEGNIYLKREFPQMDYIKSTSVRPAG